MGILHRITCPQCGYRAPSEPTAPMGSPRYGAAFILNGDGWTISEHVTAVEGAVMTAKERNGRRRGEKGKRVLADLPGDPGPPPVMYWCPEHGYISPDNVNWTPDLEAKCPYCGKPLKEIRGGEV